jgi:hypothetical protein
LGRSGVLTGQKREPIPPASTATHTLFSVLAEDFLDLSNELLRPEGLRDKIVRATSDGSFPVRVLTLRSKNTYRGLSTFWF